MRNSFLVRAFAATLLALGLAGTSVAQQAVRVGSTPTGVPFTFLDTKTNQISGIMVDLMKAIGKDQGFAIEITPMTFSTLIAALQANKIDVIAAAMYITPTRQEVVDFSDPIITYGEGLFVGYRWYDARDVAVAFPFGHGLSYTTFGYSDLTVRPEAGGYVAKVRVTNAGDRDGHEVVRIFTCQVCGVLAEVRARARSLSPRELSAAERRRYLAELD
jgi:hypothetical protein